MSYMNVDQSARRSGRFGALAPRIVDRSGNKRLPIGKDGFAAIAHDSVFVDKTLLVADVLDSNYGVTLFCRPRRFGKTLNMTMLKAFFEIPVDGGSNEDLFEGTSIWDAGDGQYREYLGAFPVIYLSLRTAKGLSWDDAYGALRNLISAEFCRYRAALSDANTGDYEWDVFNRICDGRGSLDDYADSLLFLARLLRSFYKKPVVILIDEYDAPVMAGYSAPNGGYYAEVVSFAKRWLTGALKDGGEALAFACLTGVQRISKESVFSDLNNLVVSTPLTSTFDEYFGFTNGEVKALAEYLGYGDHIEEARSWYDGYRFGGIDVYNPWSVLNYFDRGCVAGVYWANTSSNEIVGELVRTADMETLERVYSLFEDGGYVVAPLDLGVVFPDVGVRESAVWSMLYLAGYLTTDLTDEPDNDMAMRPLRIPNTEIARIFRNEIVRRFASVTGDRGRLARLHAGLSNGGEAAVTEELTRALASASVFDIVSENSCHLFLLGLCFGMPGYSDPISNRERGRGRFDIQIEPTRVREGSLAAFGTAAQRPYVTIEVKYGKRLDEEELMLLAKRGLAQIAENGYDEDLTGVNAGRLRWGIAFSAKRVTVACERVE